MMVPAIRTPDPTVQTAEPLPTLQVRLLGCSRDPAEVAYSAFMLRRAPEMADRTWEKMKNGEIPRSTIQRALQESSDYESRRSLNRVAFVFVAHHLSRAAVAYCRQLQIVPVEAAETGGLSSITDAEPVVLATPPAFRQAPELMKNWEKLQTDILEFRRLCARNGIDEDEARLTLPPTEVISLQLAMSFQELQAFLDHALCERSQREIREMSRQIYELMKKEFPVLAKRLGNKCWENRNLYCEEPYEDYLRCRWHTTRPHKNDLKALWRKPPPRNPSEPSRIK